MVILGGPCFALGLFMRLQTGATLYWQDDRFFYVDICPASTAEKFSLVLTIAKAR